MTQLVGGGGGPPLYATYVLADPDEPPYRCDGGGGAGGRVWAGVLPRPRVPEPEPPWVRMRGCQPLLRVDGGQGKVTAFLSSRSCSICMKS